MLVKIVQTKKEEVVKNIDLPYCSSDAYVAYQINEDQTILKLVAFSDNVKIEMYDKDYAAYDQILADALKLPVCGQDKILKMATRVHDKIGKSAYYSDTLQPV